MPTPAAPRRVTLANLLDERDVDAALVTDLVNVGYLTGFSGSNGALVVLRDGTAAFATDGRYVDQAEQECPDIERLRSRTLVAELVAWIGNRDVKTLAVETHTMSVDSHQELTGLIEAQDRSLTSLDRAVEQLRVVKDESELDALRRACDVSTQALAELFDEPLAGRTEREIARDLEWKMYAHGAEAIAFDTIVATGPNSAIPHHQPTDRVIAHGDLLKIDFGARVDGYHADCTRTVVLGEAADWQREIYAAVRESQQAGLDACVADAVVADIDGIVRHSLDEAGYLEQFTTGLGHGVGLQIHEDPFFAKANTARLMSRTPLTMEPGIYLPGRGGVRIEDTVVVGDGAPEVLTTMTKDLLVLG